MNEEQLASALSTHIDTMLTGQPATLKKDVPEELHQLLALADQLAAIDLPPRPSFGPQLKQSLQDQQIGASGGSAGLGSISWVVLLGLIGLTGAIGLAVTTAILTATLLLPQPTLYPVSTPRTPPTAAAPVHAPVTVSPTPSPTLTTTMTPTPAVKATSNDSVMPTAISETDWLDPMTTPIPATQPYMVGQPDGQQPEDNSDSSYENNAGDHDRGHGNEDEHHDEDNPNRGHRSDDE